MARALCFQRSKPPAAMVAASVRPRDQKHAYARTS